MDKDGIPVLTDVVEERVKPADGDQYRWDQFCEQIADAEECCLGTAEDDWMYAWEIWKKAYELGWKDGNTK